MTVKRTTCSDFDSFSPHGEGRGLRPRVPNHGRACGVARAASFETAGKSRPPQTVCPFP